MTFEEFVHLSRGDVVEHMTAPGLLGLVTRVTLGGRVFIQWEHRATSTMYTSEADAACLSVLSLAVLS